jgi:MoxR-like ATPase
VISLVACAQARALLRGREYVVPDDVKALAVPALAHRVVSAGSLGSDGEHAAGIVRGIVERTPVAVTDAVR